MSMDLSDAGGHTMKINAWNWGVLHHFVAQANAFSSEEWEAKRGSGGGEFDAASIARLLEVLERELLPRLKPGQRLFYDGTVTDLPDDGTFYRAESELWKNYSLHFDVLLKTIEFFRSAVAPVSFF